MRRSGPRTTAGISLFPFLAVLMCTMGALLVVLIAIARNARQQALAEARTVSSLPPNQGLREREDLLWRIDQLRAAHQATQAELADARHELAHLEAHARRLRGELAALAESEAALADRHAAQDESRSSLAAELSATQARLEETHRKIRALAKQTPQPAFAVIPYQGPHGTRRRPIYIECRADKVILQPEGIELSEADFLLPVGPASPLASALRAANEVFTRRGLRQESSGQPYPLLLVRPDGVGAYYAARTALAEWGSEFGYELIDADWNLEFPPPDPELETAMQLAVSEARDRLKTLLAMAPRRMRDLHAPRFGSVQDELDGAADGTAGSAQRKPAPRARQPRDARWIEGEAAGLLAGQQPVQRNPYAEVPLPGDAPPDDEASGRSPTASGPPRKHRPGTLPRQDPGGVEVGPYSTAAAEADLLAGGTAHAAPQLDGAGAPPFQPRSPARRGTERWGPLATRTGADHNSAPEPGGELPSSASLAEENPTATAASAGQLGQENLDTAAEAEYLHTRPRRQPTSTASVSDGRKVESDGQHEMPPEASLAAGSRHSGAAGRVGHQGTLEQTSTADEPGEKDANTAADAHRAPSGQRAASASAWHTPSASSSSTHAPATSALAASPSSEPAGPPMASLPEVTLGSPPQSLAKRRGRDWGLPRQAARATPVTRPIKMRVESDRLVVRGENPAERDQRVIPVGDNTLAAVDELAAVVAERVETWGMAGRGMYWRPLLVVEVAPGGEARFAELQALLADSGLDIRRVPLRTADRRASYPRTQTPD